MKKRYALYIALVLSLSSGYGFDLPIWHADARWKVPAVTELGSGALGRLDGPRLETMTGWAVGRSNFVSTPAGGPYGYFVYDSLLDRLHFAAGSGARGYADGPFTRARFGSHSYSQVRRGASNSRFVYMTEPQNNKIIRRLDFVEQTVSTVQLNVNVAGMTVHSDGRLFVKSHYDSLLHIVRLDGSIEVKKLDMVEGTGQFVGISMVLDEGKNRMYASSYSGVSWYVYYWDLSDGSFHGVLPIGGTALRGRSEPGPFEGTNLYNQMNVGWGRDDPEKRYLYLYPNDSRFIHRLDLTDRIMWTSSKSSDTLKFISSGTPGGYDGWTMWFNELGDLVTDIPYWDMPRTVAYKRVK